MFVITLMSPAAEYAGLPLLPPYLHPGHPEYIYGVNFASGGSGALSQTAQGSVSSSLNSLVIVSLSRLT